MVKRLTVECDFYGQKVKTNLYIGDPADDSEPLHFQQVIISKKGGTIPHYLIDAFAKIHAIAKKNRVSFESVVEYAMQEIKQFEWLKDLEQVDEISNPSSKRKTES